MAAFIGCRGKQTEFIKKYGMERKMSKRKKRILIILGIVVIVFIALRIYLPFFIRGQINQNIREMEGYTGGVENVSLGIMAGRIRLSDLTIYDQEYPEPDIPFIDLAWNEVTVDWGQLLRGRLHAHVHIDSLVVNYVVHEVVEPEPVDIVEMLQEIMDFRIDIDITNSAINFVDLTSDPVIDISVSNLDVRVRNLINQVMINDTLPSTIQVTATVMETGLFQADLDINYMQEIPDFDMEMELEELDLTGFNDFAEAYGGFEFHQGFVNIYAETAAYDGAITGYVQPLLEDVEITPTEDEAGIFRQFYEQVLDIIASILESPGEDYIATRVEFEGRIDDPDVRVLRSVWLLLRNAFIEGFSKGIEDLVDFEELVEELE